jgi:antitoxin component YwqK of YwqJK toxin-antitoxin module
MEKLELQDHREYFPSGRLKAEWSEKDGKLEGLRRLWFDNGQLFAEAEYHNGVINGMLRQWSSEGILVLLAYLENDEYHGPYKSWWQSGIPKEDGVYVQGKRQKGFQFYKLNGDFWKESEGDP